MCYTNLLYSTGKFLETYRLKREEGGGADIWGQNLFHRDETVDVDHCTKFVE
jgi:hypothetical protein